MQFKQTNGLQAAKHAFAVIILCNMLNFAVKSYPIYCIVIYRINNSSIKCLLSYMHNWIDKKIQVFGLDDIYSLATLLGTPC